MEVQDQYMDRAQEYRISKSMFIKLPDFVWEKIAPRSRIRLREFKLSNL